MGELSALLTFPGASVVFSRGESVLISGCTGLETTNQRWVIHMLSWKHTHSCFTDDLRLCSLLDKQDDLRGGLVGGSWQFPVPGRCLDSRI